MYKFQKLTNARSFVLSTVKPYFIFVAPDEGYLVVNSREAKKLWADGHKDIPHFELKTYRGPDGKQYTIPE